MKKNTFLVAALLAAVSANTLADEPEKLLWGGDAEKTDAYSIWDNSKSVWTKNMPGVPIPIPTNWIPGATAVFNETGLNPIDVADSIKISGEIVCSNIEVGGAKNYYITYNSSTKNDKLTGTGALIKEGTSDFVLLVSNELEKGTIVRDGRVCAESKDTFKPNVFGTKVVLEGGGIALAEENEGDVLLYNPSIEIPEGKTGAIYTGRRIQIAGEISGAGDLIVYSGGDRTFLAEGKEGTNPMHLDNFKGNLTVASNKGKYKAPPAYYGLLLSSPKTYDNSIEFSKEGVDSTFWNRTITVKDDGGLTGCSGVRCFAIGELKAEKTGFIGGYGSGNSETPWTFYMIGGLNTDVVLPLTLNSMGDKNRFSIIKVGTGTYTFTEPNNCGRSFMGLNIWEGAAYINIPVTDNTTALCRPKEIRGAQGKAMVIYADAIGGGNGRISGIVELNGGTLEIGYHGVGELVLADTLSGNNAAPLTVNSGKVEFELSTTIKYDKLSTNRAATFNGNKIIVKMAGYYNIKDGDEFTILTSAQKTEGDTYEVEYENLPEGLTLTAREEPIDNGADKPAGYKIIIKATGSATGGNPGDEDPQVDPEPNAIETTEAVNEVSVYPNPSDGEFYVEGNDIQSIQVYNNQGQLVAVETAATKIDLSGMAKGIYFAKIKVGNDTVVKKLVIK